MAGMSHYAASKWATFGLVKSAALELGPSGVTVNCVSPGPVETGMAENEQAYASPPGDQPATRSAYLHALSAQSPLPVPWNQPEEVAAAMVFLASRAARNITGTEIAISTGNVASNVV